MSNFTPPPSKRVKYGMPSSPASPSSTSTASKLLPLFYSFVPSIIDVTYSQKFELLNKSFLMV